MLASVGTLYVLFTTANEPSLTIIFFLTFYPLVNDITRSVEQLIESKHLDSLPIRILHVPSFEIIRLGQR